MNELTVEMDENPSDKTVAEYISDRRRVTESQLTEYLGDQTSQIIQRMRNRGLLDSEPFRATVHGPDIKLTFSDRSYFLSIAGRALAAR